MNSRLGSQREVNGDCKIVGFITQLDDFLVFFKLKNGKWKLAWVRLNQLALSSYLNVTLALT